VSLWACPFVAGFSPDFLVAPFLSTSPSIRCAWNVDGNGRDRIRAQLRRAAVRQAILAVAAGTLASAHGFWVPRWRG
jgi:hypothetical protein